MPRFLIMPGRALVVGCWLAALIQTAGGDQFERRDGYLLDLLHRSPQEEPAEQEPGLDLRRPGGPRPGRGGDLDLQADRERSQLQREAEEHAAVGRWAEVLQQYQALIRLQPGHRPYYMRAAVAATLAGRYEAADSYFAHLAQRQSLDPSILAAWAKVLIHLERWADARAALQTGLSSDPSHVLCQYYRLVVDVQAGKGGDTAGFWLYRRPAELVAALNVLLSERAYLVEKMGSAGLQTLVTTLCGPVLPVDLSEVRDELAVAQRGLGTGAWREALLALRAAQRLGVDRPLVAMEIARCELELSFPERAIERAEAVWAAHPGQADVAYAFGYILINAGEYDRAVDLLTDLQRGSLSRPDIDFSLACALAGAGRMDEAWPILYALYHLHRESFARWMEGDAPYLRAMRADPRFREWSGFDP
jgi:tetratricopeptide (TPR) repeat protein